MSDVLFFKYFKNSFVSGVDGAQSNTMLLHSNLPSTFSCNRILGSMFLLVTTCLCTQHIRYVKLLVTFLCIGTLCF